MLNFFAITLFFIISSFAFGDTLVVNGKHYNIRPSTPNICGQSGSPELAAAQMSLSLSQKMAENTYMASCQVDPSKDCSQQKIKQFGLNSLFTFIRSYPSISRNNGCQELRTTCENLCVETKIYSEKICMIECNQYETWNK